MNHCRRFKVEKACMIFQTYVTFSIAFSNTYDDYLLALLLIHFFCNFGKQKRFLPSGAYVFLTSSVHVPLDAVFSQI